MDARRNNYVWLVGGTLTIVVMVVASWFLLISPKLVEADDVRAEAEDASLQLSTLRKRIADLEVKYQKRDSYVADLEVSEAALPTSNNVSNFLRRLQDFGEATGVQVKVFSVSPAIKSTVVPAANEVPITLAAEGSSANLSNFIRAVQNSQSRAVLVKTITVGAAQGTSSGASASLTLSVFCLNQVKPDALNNCHLSA